MNEVLNLNACEFATLRHGTEYAMYHLAEVAKLVSDLSEDKTLIRAAWLHDILEDTETTPEEIEIAFGPDVLALVKAVTDEPGANRRERWEKTYPKIKAHGDPAVLLKLCDRIANVERSWRTRDGRLFMYRNEYPRFRETLGGCRDNNNETIKELWKQLDSLLCWRQCDR